MILLKIILISALVISAIMPPLQENNSVEVVKIRVNDTLRYGLGFFGDEEGASVISFPEYNALQNEDSPFRGFCSSDRQPLIYCYKPVKDFEGADTVVFRISKGDDGSGVGRTYSKRTLIIKLCE